MSNKPTIILVHGFGEVQPIGVKLLLNFLIEALPHYKQLNCL